MEIVEVLVSVPAIVAATEWAKSVFSLSGRLSQAVAVLFGVLFSLLGLFIGGDPFTAQTASAAAATGFLYGLAASGFYDVAYKPSERLNSVSE